MRPLIPAVLLALLSGCAEGSDVTRPIDASAAATGIHYTLTKYPASLGGSQSRGMAISNDGVVAGWSNTFGNGARHAVIWRDGVLTDLGTLGQQGGLSSTVPWPGINNNGMVVGISQTDEIDPLDESWSCEEGGFVPNGGTNLACRGFVWENGVMHNLNDLVDSDDVLLSAQDINDAGVITGRLLDHVTGETVMFVATPR